MTTSLHRARVCSAAVYLCIAAGVYMGVVWSPWLYIPALYGAALAWWCAEREYALHRRARFECEVARRAAFEPDVDDLGHDPDAELRAACCDVWFVSRRAEHAAGCRIAVAQRRARGEAA